MPTLQQITLAHSRRLSDIYRSRDIRIAQAQSVRDAQLRALPAASAAFSKYDDELSVARDKQLATEDKVEAARSAAIVTAIDRRSDRLEDAQITRRSGDVDAIAAKRHSEDAANHKYEAAIAGLRDAKDRNKAAQEAEQARREDLDLARKTHDDALAASQQRYRASVDEALMTERRDSREGERAYLDAISLGEKAARAAKSIADQHLAQALSKLPEAEEVLHAWRDALAAIAADTKKAEKEAFSAFRRELDALKT